MRAGIDLDGVLYPWSDTARALLRLAHGVKVTPSTSWNHIKDSISPEMWRWLWAEGVSDYGLFRVGQPYPGAIQAMQNLAATGMDIVIITARPSNAKADTAKWLIEHGVPASEMHVVSATENKATLADVAPCDFYVDDKPENVADYVNAGRRAFLWTQLWNMGKDVPGSKRIGSWGELYDALHEIDPHWYLGRTD